MWAFQFRIFGHPVSSSLTQKLLFKTRRRIKRNYFLEKMATSKRIENVYFYAKLSTTCEAIINLSWPFLLFEYYGMSEKKRWSDLSKSSAVDSDLWNLLPNLWRFCGDFIFHPRFRVRRIYDTLIEKYEEAFQQYIHIHLVYCHLDLWTYNHFLQPLF